MNNWKVTLKNKENDRKSIINIKVPKVINGRFYNEMEIKFDSEAMAVQPSTPYAAEIMNKYGLKRFGLSQLHWETMMYERGVLNDIQKRVKEILYEQ